MQVLAKALVVARPTLSGRWHDQIPSLPNIYPFSGAIWKLPVERLPLAAHQRAANKATGRVSLKKQPLHQNNLAAPTSAFSPLLQFG
jgi:hypothetical protein